ncbi:MAG: hypothetical protein A2X17_02035 [Bacteroidetes bacterium GWF2_41_61]|nr:MAG: hypothetical protein A2X17_02035 [Bacteroidetes bacterium GWF2_41_61]
MAKFAVSLKKYTTTVMKRLLTIFTIIFILFPFFNTTSAQSSLSGRVTQGQNSAPAEFASVVLKELDSKIVAGAMTDNKGRFTIANIKSGEYLLQVSFIGYRTNNRKVVLIEGKNVMEEPVNLKESEDILGEAVVTASYSQKQSDIERTKINTAGSIAASRGSITDLLKSASSVTIDNDNKISIRGNSNILLLIDGIPTTVGSLDGIPASATESVEIITNPDAKYDSEGTGGIINVITKKEKRDGISLVSTLNYGLYSRVNGDIMTAYNKNGWNLALNYSGKYHQERIQSDLFRNFYSTSASIEQNIASSQKQNTNIVGFNAIKRFESGDLLTINLKYMHPEILNSQNITNINTSIGGGNFINRVNEFHHIRTTGEAIGEYKMVLKKEISDLTFRGSFSRTKGERPGEYYEDGVFVQKSDGGGHPTNFSFQSDYAQKIPGIGLAEGGLKFFSRGNTFKTETYLFDQTSQSWIYNTFLSSDLTHDEDILSGYLNFSSASNKSFTYKIGVRAEYSTSFFRIIENPEEIYTTKLFLSPSLLLKQNLSNQSSLAFSFTRRITRPTYPQINPYVNMIDKTVFETGNKNLKPEEVSKFEVAYNLGNNGHSLMASLYLSSATDFITQVSSLYDQNSLMLTYVNGEKSIKSGIEINGRYKFSSLFAMGLNSNLYYGKTTGESNNFDLTSSSVMFSGNLTANITPAKKGDFSLQYFYTSPQTFPQFKTKSVHYMDIGYKRGLIKDKLSATISVSDIFNTKRWDIESDNRIYSLKNNSKNQSRVVWIGLTFNINKMQLSKPTKKDEEADGALIKLGL